MLYFRIHLVQICTNVNVNFIDLLASPVNLIQILLVLSNKKNMELYLNLSK